MTPSEFRQLQQAASLSDEELAAKLGCTREHVRRMKATGARARPIMPATADKMRHLSNVSEPFEVGQRVEDGKVVVSVKVGK